MNRQGMKANLTPHLAAIVVILAGCGFASPALEAVSGGQGNPWTAGIRGHHTDFPTCR
jgi:hypothetical protein